MSAQSIALGLPNPLIEFPSRISAPISGINHVPFTQVLNSGSTGVLFASQCLSPFIINFIGSSTGTFQLPDAFTLSQAYGNSSIPTAVSSQIPGFSILPSVHVQVGDVFQIPLTVLSTSSQSVTFLAGTGATGQHVTTNYSGNNNHDSLVIQFTAVGPSLGTCAYTLQ